MYKEELTRMGGVSNLKWFVVPNRCIDNQIIERIWIIYSNANQTEGQHTNVCLDGCYLDVLYDLLIMYQSYILISYHYSL
jgi:hypothetical protein